MTGKGIPHRHLCRKVGRLSDRNVNEVCLYFKELRIHSATRPTLNANIAVKALPEGAKTIGAGAKRDETGAENDEPTLKLDFNPKAKRKPGQVLKLTTTFAELTSPKGAKFGWVDPVGPKTREEAWESIRKSQEEISSRPGIFMRKYKKDTDGKLTTEIEQEVRVKELGRSIGSTVGRVSTQAFQAAGGVIDGNGKLRCPPGTPNANQFTDVDMTNCGTITAGTVVRSLFRIGKRMDAMAAYGAEVRKYGRALTPYEREQQNRFEATRGSAVLGRDATALADADFNARVQGLLGKYGVTADEASSSANADLIQGLHGLFREKYGTGREAEADAAFKDFLFGTFEGEKRTNQPTLGGGIFADAGLAGEEFSWEGDFSPESIAENTKRYDEMMKTVIAANLPADIQQFIRSSDPKEREIAEKHVQAIRERHHAAQREFIQSFIHLQDKYPDAVETVGALRALMPYDLGPTESFLTTEGSTIGGFDEFGDIKVPISFNALGMALHAAAVDRDTFQISDDGSIFIDAPGAASEAQKRALLLSALEEINDAILYAEIVADGGWANETSAARLQAALGLDPIRGKARHVAFHEFAHVLQNHAVQQKIIDAWEKDGKVVVDTPQGLVEFVEPPSTWTSEQWADAVSGLMFNTNNAYKFPPGGAYRFEKSLVNLFAGQRYQSELLNAEAAIDDPDASVDRALKLALIEGSAEIFAQRELGILGGPEVDDSIGWMLPENITAKKVRDIPYDIPPEYVDEPPTPGSPETPDIPTNTGPPTDSPPGAGGTVINVTIHAPINIVINNNYGADEPGDAPALPDGPKPKQVDIGWNDIAGHIYFDNETQWQPGSTHNLPIEQNPDEISRFVDVAFGLGPEEGGPDPDDPLGEIRQTKDAYWKMAPEQMDARYEKLESEYKKLVEKSRTEPLTADEQARMWLAIKGMRQVLDVNTRKSKLSDEEIEKYKARGINPQPGKYMRRPDSALNRRKDLRTGPIEKRKSRGYDDIVEVDDDELAHWSREIADHVGDAIGGKDGFDASSRDYTPGSVRNTPGMTSKEKRKLNPNYKPTQEEVDSATLVSDPALVGRRKMDQMSANLTPEQKDIVESDSPVEMSNAWTTVGDAVGGDTESLRSAIDTSARARQRIRDGAGTMGKPDSKTQDELLESQLRDTIIPTLDVLEKSTVDTDMSFVAAMELDDDLTPGTKIDHGGPIRGLLIDGQSADSLKFADPSTAKRVMVTMPAGSRAMHTKNGHDGDTDGVLIPPGTLEVMKVDPDGTVVLMPTRQKTKSEVLGDLADSVDSIDAERGSLADSEKRALKRLLDTEISNTDVPQRQTRGASGDASTRLLQTTRSSAIGTAFRESGSSFFGTESTNMDVASLGQPVDNSNRIGRMERIDQTRSAKAAEMSKLFSELEKVRDGSTENEEYWNLFNDISEQTRQLIFSSTAEELTKTVEEAVFKYHEGFDDRPRIAITPEQLTGLLGDGALRNIFDEKPGSLAASLQKSFEGDNGLADATPDNLRSQFGYLVHATSQKEIQDYLDGLPADGLIRSPRFFSEGPEFSQHSEFKAGGKSVELIMVPETARRTAYTKGDIMDGARQATPMLSTDRGEVLTAHVSGPESGNSEIDKMRETIGILDNIASGTYTAFGTPSTSTRSSRSSSSGPSAEAVVGGGIRTNDIEAIKVNALDLNAGAIEADEVGGRERLKNILRQSLIEGDLDEILDKLLTGNTEGLPDDAQHLILPFNRMRLVLSARKAQAEHNARGGQPPLIFGNPDGFDITDIDAFTDLKHIDPNSSTEEKLFQRLRYDSFGGSMRNFTARNERNPRDADPNAVYTPESLKRRNDYYTNGRLTVLSQDSDMTSTTGTTGTPDGGSGQPIDVKPVNPKTVDLINAEVEKGRTTGASGLSRVGKGQRTQIDVRRSKLIEKITYDDSTNELIVTWKGNASGRGTERYTGFPPELIRVLEETFKDDSDGSSNPILISEAVNHIANVASTSERMPNESAHAAALSEADKARLRSEGLRSISRTTRSSTASDIESRVSRSISDPDSISTRSTSSSREVRGTSGNRSTTPPAKRKVADVYRDVSELGSPDNDGGLHQLSDEELFEKFGVERSGNMALVDGQELFVANDIETAAALIAAGYHVELGPDAPSPTLLVQASAKLQKEIDAFLKSEKKDPTAVIDTCRLYAGGTNLWCEGGLGTMRADMPQIAGRMRGEDTPAAQAAKAGAVKVDWKGGTRDADGNLTKLTSEEQTRFDELKAKHAKLNKDGTVSPHTFEEGEMEEFYSMVDWNDTEANLTEEFKDYVKRLSAKTNPDKNPDEVIYDESGIDPESLAVSQGQIQMSKTGGMVTSMKNHDSSFKAYMADAHPDIEYGSDEYYDMRNRWLYGNSKPDGSAFAVPLIDENGQKLNKDGDPIGEGGTQGIISQPWFTSGSIISTSDGYVVDGHHRWASFIAYNHGQDERAKLKLKSVVIDAPIQDALAIGKAYQEHWGIKAAKLGKEEMFERVDGAGSMDMDAKKAHIDKLFVEDADGIPLAQQKAREIYKDLYEQKEGFGYVQKIGTRSASDPGRELTPEEITALDRRIAARDREEAIRRGEPDPGRELTPEEMARLRQSDRGRDGGTTADNAGMSTRSMSQSAYMLGSLIPIATVLGGVAAAAGGFDRKPKNLDGKKRPNKPGNNASGLKKRDYLTEMAAHILKTENDKSSLLRKIKETSGREKQSLNDELKKLNSYSDSLRQEFDLTLNALDEDSQKKMNEVVNIMDSNMNPRWGASRLSSIRNQPRSTRSSRGGSNERRNIPPTAFAYIPEEADVPGEKAFRDNSIYVTENADGTFNAYTIESVPGTDSGYLKQAGDKHASLDAAKNAAKKQGSDTAGRSTRSTRSSRELPPLVFGYDEVEEVDVPGKKAFRDNSTYVTENADGTFNAYTIENVPGTELGYLKQAGDNHASLDAAKNAASKQKSRSANLSTRSSSTRSRTGSPTRTRKGAGIAGRIIGSERAQNLLERMGLSEDDADATQFIGELATGFAVGGPPGLASIFGRRVSRDIADAGLREAVKRGWLSPDQAGRVERQLLDRVAPEGLPDRLTDAIAKGTQIATSESTREKARELASTAKQFVGENERIQRARESLGDVGDSIRQRFSRREKIGPIAASTRSSSGDVSPSANAVPSTEAQKTWKKLHDLESNKKGAINDMTDSELAELGISRSSRDGIIDGKPVYVAETQESAVALMSLGYNVELGDGARARKVKRAVAQLQKEIDAYLDQRTDMSPEERASYKIDSCRMYIANTNIFCGKNIGTARMNMPQISGRMKGDDTVAARAAKAGLVKTTWEARGDLTPEQRSVFDKLKARHPNPDNKFPEGESPLTDEEKKEFYSLVDWKDTEVDFVPKFMDHLRRVSGRDDIVKTRNKVNTSEFTASQGQIQAEKVSGMLAGIDAAHDGFVQWAESRGAKRGSKEYLDLREQWLDGKFDGQIPILDENGQQVVKKGKPQFADPWWAKGTIITSKDGYVVDGHHRWAAVDAFNLTLGENEPPLTINTQELDIGIFDALNLAKSYQTEIGIKEAKLGLEDPYAKTEGIPAMSADEFGQFDADTDTNVGSNYEKVRDSGYYLPNGPYLKTTGRNPSGSFVGRERPRTTRDIFSTARSEIASTRSSRQPRAFSDDYPSMASIGIDPRPSSGPDGEFEDDGNRALAEGILNGATKAQQKEMEQIAADAVASVQKQQDEIRAQIVRDLGSEEDLDDLLTFDRPTPKSWAEMSNEKRAAITEMLDRVSQIKESTFSETRDRLVEMAETRRRIRNANITAAKRVARPALPSTRSARTAPSTGTRFASDIAKGIGQQVDGEKLTRDLAGAFKKGGAAGVLSQLRKTLRNDSSGWAIGYALEEGYITKAQASFLRKLAARLFKKPPSKRGAKSLNAGKELIFADLLSPPLVIHKETSWL